MVRTYLDVLVPASGDNDRVLRVGAEADAADPLGVALVGDGVLAVTEGVPQLDGPVAGARDDLAVVRGEGDGQNVVVVADEATGGDTGAQLPQTESLVPGGGKSVGAVRADHTVADNVVVALEGALRVAVGGLVAGQVPDDEGTVTRGGQKHVGVLERGGQAGNPAGVALEGAAKDELLSHVVGVKLG